MSHGLPVLTAGELDTQIYGTLAVAKARLCETLGTDNYKLLKDEQILAIITLLQRYTDPEPVVIHRTMQTEELMESNVQILGNATGTGKSYVTASLLKVIQAQPLLSHREPVVNTTISACIRIHSRDLQYQTNQHSLVMVGNLQVAWGWEHTFARLGIVILKAYTKARAQEIVEQDDFDSQPHIILATGTGLQFLAKRCYLWRFVVCDEPDTHQTIANCMIRGEYALLVSATWHMLLHQKRRRRGFIARTLGAISPKDGERLLRNLVVYTMSQQHLQLPPPTHVTRTYTDPPAYNIVRGIVPPHVFHYIDTEDWRAVFSTFKVKTTNPMAPTASLISAARTYWEQKETEIRSRLHAPLSEPVHFSYHNHLQEVQAKLTYIQERMDSLDKGYVCAICTSSQIIQPMTTLCQHTYCYECITNWLHIAPDHSTNTNTCPLCRKPVSVDDLVPTKDAVNLEVVGPQTDKLATVADIVQAENIALKEQCRILIFNASSYGLSVVQSYLKGRKLVSTILAGTEANKKHQLDEFQSGTKSILLLDCTESSAGVDGLQCSTTIIFYHSMTPNIRQQIIGRAIRLGRDPTLPLTIYDLKHSD